MIGDFWTAMVIGALLLGSAGALVVRHLSGGKKSFWLPPAAIGGQLGLTLWSASVAPLPWVPESLLLAWGLLTLALTDWIALRLPDALTLPLVASGLLLAGLADAPAHGIGALAGYGGLSALAFGYRMWRGRDGIGGGDVKLAAVAGAWVGWQALPSVILLGAVIALSGVAVLRLTRPISGAGPVPFGPSLCLAIWIVWLHGPLPVSPS